MVHYIPAATTTCCVTAARRGWLDNAEARCIAFGGIPVDDAISQAILRVVEPAALEAALVASQDSARQDDEVRAALEREREAARYAAQRAAKQYDAADPENRLVSAELEQRWNQALQHVQELDQRLDQHGAQHPPTAPPTLDELTALATDLAALWEHPDTDVRLKKRIVRTLIHEVVAEVDAEAGEIVLIVHWQGGVHTELRVARRRRGQSNAHTATEIVDAVRVLIRLCGDDMIAGVLNRNGLRTGRGNRWTRERVTGLRSTHKIPRHCPQARESQGWMNLTEASKYLGVSPRTLRLAAERGDVEAQHPLTDGPWVFNRTALETPAAVKLVERVRSRSKDPAKPAAKQTSLDLSNT